MKRRIVIVNTEDDLRVLDIIAKKKTIEAVYHTEHYDRYTGVLNAFSSRYTFVFYSIDISIFDNSLDVKIPKVYHYFKNNQRHPIMAKYIIYHYAKNMHIPLYRVPIKMILYSNELCGERELSVNAFIKSTYRLIPIFEKI